MNDEEKVSVNSDRLKELIDDMGTHRKLADRVAQLFEQQKVSTRVTPSMIWRMMTSDQGKFKAKDLRAVAVALGTDLEAIADMKRPGFISIECIRQELGQSLYSAINSCDLINIELLVEPSDEVVQKKLVEFVELIESLYDERGTDYSTMKHQVQDTLAIKQYIDFLSPEVSVLVGKARQLLPFEKVNQGFQHRHFNSPYEEFQTAIRRVFDKANPYIFDEREEAWLNSGGGVDFAKVLLIRFAEPHRTTKTEQIELDPGALADTGPLNRSLFVEAENLIRAKDGINPLLKSLVELENLPLSEIRSGYIKAVEKQRREDHNKLF